MRKFLAGAAIFMLGLSTGAESGEPAGEAGTKDQGPLHRTYREGETLAYHMKGKNEDWSYEIQAKGVAKRDAAGTYYEEYGWSDLRTNRAIILSSASLSFRQLLSLDLSHPDTRYMSIPDLSKVDPVLIGPITDLLTFYADLILASTQRGLRHAGDRVVVARGGANSWADGSIVILGQDSIDFDIQLDTINAGDGTAVVLVRHIPPAKPGIKIPAEWMKDPVGDGPNNWIEVQRRDDKGYLAQVGKETFEVRLTVSLEDGKILGATLMNRVEEIRRTCTDAELLQCANAERHTIERRIAMDLIH
jgi:hypothetical protein